MKSFMFVIGFKNGTTRTITYSDQLKRDTMFDSVCFRFKARSNLVFRGPKNVVYDVVGAVDLDEIQFIVKDPEWT